MYRYTVVLKGTLWGADTLFCLILGVTYRGVLTW